MSYLLHLAAKQQQKTTNKHSTHTQKKIPLAITIYIATLALFLGTLGAARFLHNFTLKRIIRAPMTDFFDVTPAGRIINRMSHDVDTIDNDFPATLRAWVSCLFSVLIIAMLFIFNDFLFADFFYCVCLCGKKFTFTILWVS